MINTTTTEQARPMRTAAQAARRREAAGTAAIRRVVQLEQLVFAGQHLGEQQAREAFAAIYEGISDVRIEGHALAAAAATIHQAHAEQRRRIYAATVTAGDN